LVIFADEVADDIGLKAALRADGELFQRGVFAGFIDAPFEVIDFFQLRHFCAHQP